MTATAIHNLLIATSNRGKRAEFARLLPSGVQLLTFDEVDVQLPPETGATFAENAILKATAAARQSNLVTLADDSGLEVDALSGAPGVSSARYAGEPPSDERNRLKLLAAMTGVPAGSRGAQFRCVVALASPQRLLATAEGVCEGAVATEPHGRFGFGYDPLFLLPDGRTMAELPPAAKDEVSHRGRAFRAILPALFAALNLPAAAEANQ